MRCTTLSRSMLGLIALGGAFVLATPSAHSQMCTPTTKDCEGEAHAEAQRCALQCPRYDTVCSDRCDDTHDILVHYCWIKSALCKATDASRSLVKATSERKSD